MLVRLYDLPEASSRVQALHDAGIELRRALAPERHVVVSWVREQFGEGWASECEVSFARLPISCFRAQRGQELVTLHAMAGEGYAYAIIGAAGPADFYANAVDAVPIAGSTPGIYAHLLRGRHTAG